MVISYRKTSLGKSFSFSKHLNPRKNLQILPSKQFGTTYSSSTLKPTPKITLSKQKGTHKVTQSHKILDLSSLQKPPLPSIQSTKSKTIRLLNISSPNSKKLTFPCTPLQVLNTQKHHLSPHQQIQILDYTQIYFIGQFSSKLINVKGRNSGFDDQRDDYNLMKGDHIGYRYQIISLLGRGSFGVVCQAYDHKQHELVAVKVLRNKPNLNSQAVIEIRILEMLKERDCNAVQIKNFLSFRSHVCLVFELLGPDLYQMLKLNRFKGLTLEKIRSLTSQILVCLKELRNMKIIHCDLKLENILLVKENSWKLKVIDFGSSCLSFQKLYTYIQSRFYRAPEILLGIPYSTAIDMWSFGCILYELFTSWPLFEGENQVDQFSRILELKGNLPPHLLAQARRRSKFYDGEIPKQYKTHRVPGSRPLQKAMNCPDLRFLDLVERCLEWDPERRITPADALNHPFIKKTATITLSKKLIKNTKLIRVTSDKIIRKR